MTLLTKNPTQVRPSSGQRQSATASAAPSRLTVAEFFAGIGLMRMGLERHGWNVVFANDIDPLKQVMYTAHFGHGFTLDDIHLLEPGGIPPVTLATASFPCTDLSLAGAMAGLAGEHSGALWGFTDLLDKLGTRRPPIILLENVTAFLTSHGGSDFRAALSELNRLGYAVDAFVLDAAWFVPQSRQRLFVIGRQGAGDGTPLPMTSRTRPPALVNFMLAHPDIRWSVRDLPAPPQAGPILETILEDLPDDAPEWWSRERSAYLLEQMSERHRALADAMIAFDAWSYGTVFRRMRGGKSTAEMRTDGIAGCLRTPKGGSAKQILFRGGFGRYGARLLTPRECARLMGADDYVLTVPTDQALFGFGDAVCVSAVEWIAENYLNPVMQTGPAFPLRLS